MEVTVEWRYREGTDVLLMVDPELRAVSEAQPVDEAALKTYLAVAESLPGWQRAITWTSVDGADPDPERWGELVISRNGNGDVTYISPELFWERVHRRFRARGGDYTS